MKTTFTFLLLHLLLSLSAFGQHQGANPIKVLANENTTTTFFFPSAIAKTITPDINFNFDYQEQDPTMGLLKGKKGRPSNLTVITDDGYIYSFALSYSQNVETFNFFLSSDMAVGRMPGRQSQPELNVESVVVADTAPKSIEASNSQQDRAQLESVAQSDSGDVGPIANSIADETYLPESDEASFSADADDTIAFNNGEGDLYDIDREEYYRIYCENNYLQKTLVRRTFRQNKRIVLKLNNMLVDRDEIYFVLQIENNSKKEYLVNGLSFFRKSGVGQLQMIMKPLYTYNLQDKIDPQSINEVVFVFKRFKISNKEEVYVVLDELENNRLVMLPLDNKQINAPTN